MPRRDLRLSDSFTFVGSFEQLQQREHMAPPPQQRRKTQSSATRMPPFAGYSSRVLGTWSVVSILFLYGCGGPLGAGDIIYAAGPRLGLLAIAVYPLVMAVPYGYIVAELCSAFPHDGGFAVWVLHAFGPFWGFQVGYWSWVSGVLTCAMMPDLALELICHYAVGVDTAHALSDAAAFAIKAALALVLALPTLFGTKLAARVCVALVVLVLLPAAVFAVWSFAHSSAHADFSQVRRTHTELSNVTSTSSKDAVDVVATGAIDVDWVRLVPALAWKYGGLNVASLFAGEVRDPARVFPRAIAGSIALSFIAMLVPLVAAIAAHRVPWSDYDSVTLFLRVAELLDRRVLFVFAVASAFATLAGRFLACLYATSFQLSGMAEHELLPAALANKRNRFRSPQLAVLITFVAALPLLVLDWHDLMSVCIAFASAVELLVLVAAVKLRLSMPYIPRPVQMPGGVATLVLATLGPATVLCYLLVVVASVPCNRYVAPLTLVPGLLAGLVDLWNRRHHRAGGGHDVFATADSSSSNAPVITPSEHI